MGRLLNNIHKGRILFPKHTEPGSRVLWVGSSMGCESFLDVA